MPPGPDPNNSLLAEIQTDIRWINKSVGDTGIAMTALEARVMAHHADETRMREKADTAIEVQLLDVHKLVAELKDRARDAADSAKRAWWVCAGIAASSGVGVGILLNLITTLVEKGKGVR